VQKKEKEEAAHVYRDLRNTSQTSPISAGLQGEKKGINNLL